MKMKILFLCLSFLLSNQLYSQLPKGLLVKLNKRVTTQTLKQESTDIMTKTTAIKYKEMQKVSGKNLFINSQKIYNKNIIQRIEKDKSNQRKQEQRNHWNAAYNKWLGKHSYQLK